ncbi:hypothetical protein MIMGU_mgv1a020719mg [Erythranthe guttata]|uniref:LisH domain-containing protein n=1 Tax=Erythranthe guttata TaxID=4155 RepID=A0A022QH95_ERYGU|nr:hypothetical protein MIMGU_mgv1a020719mg [Erythranthe guttata]
MGKQSKSRKKEDCAVNGKVTPVQIAFIVDRYLSDNNYTQTRPIFRSEASHLISKSPVQEAPKSLLSLEEILDEYITLKEQKVWMDQERHRLEHESLRIQNLLSGMQDVMNTYTTSGINAITSPLPPTPPPPDVASGAMVSQAELSVMTPAGYFSMYKSSATMSMSSKLLNTPTDPPKFSTPITTHVTTKRKGSKNVSDCLVTAKRSRRHIQPKDSLVSQSSTRVKNEDKSSTNSSAMLSLHDNVSNASPLQGSAVVKCLFNQKLSSSPANSPVLKTPPQPSSSQTDKSTNYVQMIPKEQTTDGTTTSESEKDGDVVDLDFPNLDTLVDFNLSEFLVDLDIEGQELCLSSQKALDSSPDSCTK